MEIFDEKVDFYSDFETENCEVYTLLGDQERGDQESMFKHTPTYGSIYSNLSYALIDHNIGVIRRVSVGDNDVWIQCNNMVMLDIENTKIFYLACTNVVGGKLFGKLHCYHTQEDFDNGRPHYSTPSTDSE